MSWKVSKTRQAAACGLLALFGAAFAVQAEDGPCGRRPPGITPS